MSAKSFRNLIITLIILVIGITVLQHIAKGFTSNLPNAQGITIMPAIQNLVNMVTIGLAVIIVILIPVYLSKRSNEKKVEE
jgi:hypothetical protein